MALLGSGAWAQSGFSALDAAYAGQSGAGGGPSSALPGRDEVSISQPNGKVTVWVEDLRVKVLGGWVALQRRWDGQQWIIGGPWTSLSFQVAAGGVAGGGSADAYTPAETYGGTRLPGGDALQLGGLDGPVQSIIRNGAQFVADDSGTTYVARNASRYVLRPLLADGSPAGSAPVLRRYVLGAGGSTQPGTVWTPEVARWRWEDKGGDWVEYDADGRIQRYGDRNDVQVSFRYETAAAGARIAAVLDHHGSDVLRFGYDAAGRLIEVSDVPRAGDTQPARQVRYAYDSRGAIATATDVLGHVVTYGYDGGGKLVSVTDQEGHERRIDYGPTHRVSAYVDADGGRTDYRYDYDRLKKLFAVRIDHPLTEAGRRVEEQWIDPEGQLVQREINGRSVSRRARSDRHELRTDERGQQVRIERDEWDNVTKTVWPDGTTSSARYAARHLGPVEEVDEAGVRTLTEYDSRGNPVRRTEAAGRAEQRLTEWTYDQYGQVLSQSVRGGGVVLPDGSRAEALEAVTAYQYDGWGNAEAVTDAEGHTTRASHDRLGNPVELTDARGGRWQTEYDARGLALAQADPLGQTVRATYDARGARRTRTDALGHTWQYAYDARGRLTQTTDPLGNAASTRYDAMGQVIEQTDSAGVVTQRNSYDRDGRLLVQEDALSHKVNYSYGEEGGGQPTETTNPARGAAWLRMQR